MLKSTCFSIPNVRCRSRTTNRHIPLPATDEKPKRRQRQERKMTTARLAKTRARIEARRAERQRIREIAQAVRLEREHLHTVARAKRRAKAERLAAQARVRHLRRRQYRAEIVQTPEQIAARSAAHRAHESARRLIKRERAKRQQRA